MTRYFGKVCDKHSDLLGERLRSNSKCIGCKREEQAKRYQTLKLDEGYMEAKRKQAREWGRNNKSQKIKTVTLWSKHKKQTDPIYILKSRIRARQGNAIKRAMLKKTQNTQSILGCDWLTLKSHLESKFAPGMTWENMGQWHIDHIIPLNSVSEEQEMLSLCRYTNLQPLWSFDNLSKGSKLLDKHYQPVV